MPFITFIIATIGRKTLLRSIESVIKQTDKDFKIIVVTDGHIKLENLVDDSRVSYLQAPKTRSPGLTRNYAFKYVSSKWIGFVDDDDVLYDRYIEELRKLDKENPILSFVLFRMITSKITPKLEIKDKIVFNETGISFSVKASVLNRTRLLFESKGSEDYVFLRTLANKGHVFKISDYVAYEVCRNNRDKGEGNDNT